MVKAAGEYSRTGAEVDLDTEGVVVEEMVPEEAASDSTEAGNTVDGSTAAGRTVVDKHMPAAGIRLDPRKPSLGDILDKLADSAGALEGRFPKPPCLEAPLDTQYSKSYFKQMVSGRKSMCVWTCAPLLLTGC
ncbi:hypothetical protein KEJ39_00890 [Candidatus Bathyarchaeota archaeon]|nr:hypothetical protein [Candidatus Bathyarchaeota archaeon]